MDYLAIKKELDNDFSIYAVKETELYANSKGTFYDIESLGFVSKTFFDKVEKHNLQIYAIINHGFIINIRFLLRSKDKKSDYQ